VPLRDIAALKDWRALHDPPAWVVAKVNEWILLLAEAPWREPSVPEVDISDAEGNPIGEIRSAVLVDAEGTEVIYEYDHDTQTVDLIRVR
jgi:hypothetical protein